MNWTDERETEVRATMGELMELARGVNAGVITADDEHAKRSDLCTKHGPGAVRVLDRFYEARLSLLKLGFERFEPKRSGLPRFECQKCKTIVSIAPGTEATAEETLRAHQCKPEGATA